MAYGSVLADNVQSSAVGLAPVFKDGGGTEIGELCRAWVNFNGSTGAIRAAFNVSSITKNTTGDYTVNLSNALPDNNYGVNASVSSSGSTVCGNPNLATVNGTYATQAPTVNALRMVVLNYAGSALIDPVYVNVSIFR